MVSACWLLCVRFGVRHTCASVCDFTYLLTTYTDDTCSALETFSDSGLYKFTFYITLLYYYYYYYYYIYYY